MDALDPCPELRDSHLCLGRIAGHAAGDAVRWDISDAVIQPVNTIVLVVPVCLSRVFAIGEVLRPCYSAVMTGA